MGLFEHEYTEISQFFNLPTIMSLHHYHDCLLTFRVLHEFVSCSIISGASVLPPHRPIREESSSSNFGFLSTVNRLSRSWNTLPWSVTATSALPQFKLVVSHTGPNILEKLPKDSITRFRNIARNLINIAATIHGTLLLDCTIFNYYFDKLN
ncbi:hypothetical protein TSAR_008062 [Trichomalopsis sarcophagae]|uniref:Uncharacterized protein n=1 Tax=Trichomalopsis sarcophagae TaxID=543379 RepID=A0A232FND1_9HYME|nr:hypothetical protein TSAR_008062 [Trichomalopsis sarcophagae]